MRARAAGRDPGGYEIAVGLLIASTLAAAALFNPVR